MLIHKKQYNLGPFFYYPLRNLDLINYRNEIMKDIETEELLLSIEKFSNKILSVRRLLKLSEEIEFSYNSKGWYLEAALLYCEAVSDLTYDLNIKKPKSRGLRNFFEYLALALSVSFLTKCNL